MIVSRFFRYSLYILIFGCIYILFYKSNQKKTYSEKPHGRSLSMFFAAILVTFPLGYLLQVLVSSILQLIKFADPQLLKSYYELVDSSFTVKGDYLLFLSITILAPIGEELLFRGVLLKGCTDYLHLNKTVSVCLTGILFGLYHGNVVQICYAIPMGILLGCIATSFHSVLPGIFLHISVNTSAYFLPTIFFHIKKTTMSLMVVSVIFIFILCYVLFRIARRYTKYLDK